MPYGGLLVMGIPSLPSGMTKVWKGMIEKPRFGHGPIFKGKALQGKVPFPNF